MNQKDFIGTLEKYAGDLTDMLSRFSRTREAMYMAQQDEGRFREIVIELIDVFKDELVDGTNPGKVVAAYFSDATQNFTGSPSYRGVENVRGVVKAVMTRAKRSPGCLRSAQIVSGPFTAPRYTQV